MSASIIEYKQENAKEVGERLKRGEVGIFPTDTIYGISSIVSKSGEERIFKAKNRPENKSLIVLMTIEQLLESDLVVPSALFTKWPAPFTAILKSKKDGSTLAVRVPDDRFLLYLMSYSGPIYSTSANLSGSPALNDFDSIYATFKDKVDFIVNGSSKVGVSSTLIDATKEPYSVLRQGSFILD